MKRSHETFGLAFKQLNLFFNPFGELSPEQRKKLAVVDVSAYRDILNSRNTAIQFHADHGRGKTTHLLALHEYYPQAEYIKLFANATIKIYPRPVCFIDSIENLNKKQRIRLYKKTQSIALTTHMDLSAELQAAGYQLMNIKISTTDEHRLWQIFNRRLEYARRSTGKIPKIDMSLIEQLKQRFGDDIRAMESFLYEKIQTMTGIENVKM